jgi:hypothetical protein
MRASQQVRARDLCWTRAPVHGATVKVAIEDGIYNPGCRQKKRTCAKKLARSSR